MSTTINASQDTTLIRSLMDSEKRIFTVEDCLALEGFHVGSPAYLRQILMKLEKTGWTVRLKQGLYALDASVLGSNTIHEFEIAMHLASTVAISHGSAFHHHGLTDQIARNIHYLSPDNVAIPKKNPLFISGVGYQGIQVKQERFFGIQQIWMNAAKIQMTDLERTLLDGLDKPKYFGGFLEVLNGFKLGMAKINIEKIIDYSLRLDASIAKRLGWVLEANGVAKSKLKALDAINMPGFCKLVVGGPDSGALNKKWRIMENLN